MSPLLEQSVIIFESALTLAGCGFLIWFFFVPSGRAALRRNTWRFKSVQFRSGACRFMGCSSSFPTVQVRSAGQPTKITAYTRGLGYDPNT